MQHCGGLHKKYADLPKRSAGAQHPVSVIRGTGLQPLLTAVAQYVRSDEAQTSFLEIPEISKSFRQSLQNKSLLFVRSTLCQAEGLYTEDTEGFAFPIAPDDGDANFFIYFASPTTNSHSQG